MTAAQAYAIAMAYFDSLNIKVYDNVQKTILDAVNQGLLQAKYYADINNIVKTMLENDGYVLTYINSSNSNVTKPYFLITIPVPNENT